MSFFPRKVSVVRKPNLASSESAVPKDVAVILKEVQNLMPDSVNSDDVSRALSGEKGRSSFSFEKYLDIDVLDVAKREKIPTVFFHLVIGDFKHANKLSPKNREYYEQAKRELTKLDGNIYASDSRTSVSKKLDDKILLRAADRAFKKSNKYQKDSLSESESNSHASASRTDWSKLQRADKELKVKLRLEGLLYKLKGMFPGAKFASKGNFLIMSGHKLPFVITPALTALEKEFGVYQEEEFGLKNSNEIRWVVAPSGTFFTRSSSYGTSVSRGELGKLAQLIELIKKLDPAAIFKKHEGFLMVISQKLKSHRLDDAFETVGKKCGAIWMGRTQDDTLMWKTSHSLEMSAAAKAKPRAKHPIVKQAVGVPRAIKPLLATFFKINVKAFSYLTQLLQLKRPKPEEKKIIASLVKKLRKIEKKVMKENDVAVSILDLLLKQRGLEAPQAA